MGEQVSERESLARAMYDAAPYYVPPPSSSAWDVLYPAALAWFAAHQPARVAPSAEEVRKIARDVVEFARGMAGDDAVSSEQYAEDAVADLFASQPTVAEVREQVARELEALLPTDDEVADPQPCSAGHDCHEAARYVTVRRAQRIARGETKGGE